MTEPAQTNGSIPDQPHPAARPARLAMYAGLALIVLGAAALYLGYNGAATTSVEVAQTPFIISGGLLGATLMGLGGISFALSVLLRVQADLRADLGSVRESVDRLTETLGRGVLTAASGAAASPNGTVVVARGSASFHRGDCRLVARAEHATPVPRAEAEREGLAACRICKP